MNSLTPATEQSIAAKQAASDGGVSGEADAIGENAIGENGGFEASDQGLLDFLRSSGPQGVTEISAAMRVTATAVRQRLVRLLALGDIQRQTNRVGRGRPTHRYSLTVQGRRRAGSNFTDLAFVLWQELRSIENSEVRRGLLSRISKRMAGIYEEELAATSNADGNSSGSNATGEQSLVERMQSVADLFKRRKVPFEVRQADAVSDGAASAFVDVNSAAGEGAASDGRDTAIVQLPVLAAQACPYPDLAEQDRGICSLEKMVFAELLGAPVKLATCRLDGDSCCTFQPGVSSVSDRAAQ